MSFKLFDVIAGRFLIIAIIISVSLAGCGGSGGDAPTVATLPPPPPPPLNGSSDDLASSAIVDVYVDGESNPSEYSEDAFGVSIHRTAVKIVFVDNATVGEVNSLLIDQSATIIAALEGFPALVVEIPDPGSLDALDVLSAELERQPFVHSVIRSTKIKPRSLPANVHAAVFNNSFPPTAPEWNIVDHHLSVRASAAWNFGYLSQLKPVVVLPDHYGVGDPDEGLFDITTIAGVSQVKDHGQYGAGTAADPTKLDFHGYEMLSIIAAAHSPAGDTEDAELVTGMVPRGIRLAVVDRTTAKDDQAFNARLMQVLREAIQTTTATVIVNYSLGPACAGIAATHPCWRKEDLNDGVVNFIREVRHIKAEKKALFVTAAGNFRFPLTAQNSPGDARSSSILNAAALQEDWTDIVTDEAYPPLKNVLVVENAVQMDELVPTAPGCVHESSFVGGQIAGIGEAVTAIHGPDVGAGVEVDGGTSQATAQLSGIAAYLTSLDPGLKPQDLIHILTTTASPLPGAPSGCTPLETSAWVADAYAAVLATDPTDVITPSSAKKRLALLDVTDATLAEGATDQVFDYNDLRRWADKLTDPVLDYPEQLYSRYDINGDGRAGEEGGPARFDLDISAGTSRPREAIYNVVEYTLLGSSVVYSEASVTDAEIICYYANTDMYTLTPGLDPFTEEFRDRELERLQSFCDPCAAAASTTKTLGGVQKTAAPDTCEGIVVTVTPTSTTLATGETLQFTATVTGAADESVVWSATGGVIDPVGRYTAGDVEGNFRVTATSVEDPGIEASATVAIANDTINIAYSYEGVEMEPGFAGCILETHNGGCVWENLGISRDINAPDGEHGMLFYGERFSGVPLEFTIQVIGNTWSGTTDTPFCSAGQFCETGGTIIPNGEAITLEGWWVRDPVCVADGECDPTYFRVTSTDHPGALIGIDVSPAGTRVAPGSTVKFSADVTGLAWSRVNWSTDGGTIDATGLFTAGTTPGTYVVTATSQQEPSISGSTTVTVTQ